MPFTAFAGAGAARPSAEDGYAEQRERMVREQVENRGISNHEILDAMRVTPRHLFVPAAVRNMAYLDQAFGIGEGATISQPYIVALMTSLLNPKKTNKVLEIGTGSGYQAAILAQLVNRVYTIEIVPELAKSARATLNRLGYSNITVRQGNGYDGWREEAPFDGIIVTAAPKEIPPVLVEQLAVGGRLVVPVGPGLDQELVVAEKKSDGSLSWTSAGRVLFVPMRPALDD